MKRFPFADVFFAAGIGFIIAGAFELATWLGLVVAGLGLCAFGCMWLAVHGKDVSGETEGDES